MIETKSTADVLKEMLTENTGRHFLDSGGAYGRAWERNQGRDFDAEPRTTLDFKYNMDYTQNVYHYLLDRLEYAPEWQERFEAFANRPEMENEHWLGCVEAWIESLKDEGHKIRFGVYGDSGNNEPDWCNTYNHDCNLSQTLQFLLVTIDDEQVCILQIHGGADVRGGYTKPRVFVANGYHDLDSMYDFAQGYVTCENNGKAFPFENPDQQRIPGTPEPTEHEVAWWTDDAYHWYTDRSNVDVLPLNEYTFVTDSENNEGLGPVILVDDEGNAHCPVCDGKLVAG